MGVWPVQFHRALHSGPTLGFNLCGCSLDIFLFEFVFCKGSSTGQWEQALEFWSLSSYVVLTPTASLG